MNNLGLSTQGDMLSFIGSLTDINEVINKLNQLGVNTDDKDKQNDLALEIVTINSNGGFKIFENEKLLEGEGDREVLQKILDEKECNKTKLLEIIKLDKLLDNKSFIKLNKGIKDVIDSMLGVIRTSLEYSKELKMNSEDITNQINVRLLHLFDTIIFDDIVNYKIIENDLDNIINKYFQDNYNNFSNNIYSSAVLDYCDKGDFYNRLREEFNKQFKYEIHTLFNLGEKGLEKRHIKRAKYIVTELGLDKISF